MAHQAGWYPDPTTRYELRYHDGSEWTHHVSNRGVTSTDPVHSRIDRFEAALTLGNEDDPERVRQMVRGTRRNGAGIAEVVPGGGGTVFDEPILVVNQVAKVFEVSNQFRIMDQHGTTIGAVRQHGQSTVRKAMRLFTSVDQYFTHRLQLLDADGHVLLHLTRPGKVFKSTVIVADGAEREVGRIVQENVFGKIGFALEAGGERLGAIKAENWRAWNFRIEDAAGTEVARITKTFEGVAKTLFTTADNYVVQLHVKPPQPLHTLVVAAAVSVDTALKQDARGFG
jgi:uncharacterized protein YxjI